MTVSAELRERLNRVLDPELGASIVELGMVGDIRVDENGHAAPVPQVLPETDEERRRFSAGEQRRAQRIAEIKSKDS